MMGQRTGGQKPLFYSFKLDDHVPADHLLRGIDRPGTATADPKRCQSSAPSKKAEVWMR